jgi:drug/metabolite transporter (DMT)-like permease
VTRRGWLLFGAMCVIWGMPYLLIRVAVRDLTPATLVFLRTAIACLILVPLAAGRGELRPLLRHWRIVLLFAVIEVTIPWLLLSSAERRISSSLAALLVAAVPLVSVALAVATGAERFDSRRLAGFGLGILGVGAIVGLDLSGTSVAGLAEMAVVCVCYAVGPFILSRYMGGLPAMGVIAASLALTALVYAPVAAVEWPSSTPSSHVIASVVTLALVCTALAFVLFFALIAEAGPVRATVITYVNPAVAALLGVAVLGETFTAGMAVGFALVLAGSVLANRASAPVPDQVPSSAAT